MPDCVVIIPARWGSSRFPGKVVAPLAGKPLVLHACDLAAQARCVDAVIVATDDERVASIVVAAGYRAVLTRTDHPSGTDRIAEVAATLTSETVIGLQADEPLLSAADLDRLATALTAETTLPLATLDTPIRSLADFLDPNIVKLTVDDGDHALYFSRSPIPYPRPGGAHLPFPPEVLPTAPTPRQHLGVYAWRRAALLAFVALPPSALERCEGLEQLRAVEAGWKIRVLRASGQPLGVDTPHDLARAADQLARRKPLG